MQKDYYEILEVSKDATLEDINKAYDRAISLINQMEIAKLQGKFPDVNIDRMKEDIDEAHKILCAMFKRSDTSDDKYYIQVGGNKIGPFTFQELSKKTLTERQLIWRTDLEKWYPAKQFIELKSLIVPIPPLLPEEQKKREGHEKFFTKVYSQLIRYFGIASVVLCTLSSIIAINSWEDYKKEKVDLTLFGGRTPVQYALRYISSSITSTVGFDAFSDNEGRYADEQLFIIRPFYAFFSTLYLQKDERDNYVLLVSKLLFSSAIFFAIIFCVVGLIRYYQLTHDK